MSGPAILVKLASWLATQVHPLPPDPALLFLWQPQWWTWSLAVALGFLIAGYLAWSEQYQLNKSTTNGFPLIVLAEQPIETNDFDLINTTGPREYVGTYIATYKALRLRLGNKPVAYTEKANGVRVHAKVSIYDEADSRLVVMDGRWSDSPQISNIDPAQDYVETLSVAFPIGPERSLDLLFQRPGEARCVAVNNDNFRYPNLAMPGRDVNGTVKVVVDLSGVYVKTRIVFKVACEGLNLVDSVKIEDNTPRLT